MSPESCFNMLPPIPELEFSEEAHKYKYDGRWLHLSPTQVLSFDLDEQAKQRIQETKEGPDGWERRGTLLHSLLENHLLGAADLNPHEFGAWWDALKSCWIWEDATILGVELRLTDKKRMGGSCDFLIKSADGSVCLGDLKTVSSEKAVKSRKPATEQLGAYLHMLARCYPKICVDKCLTVVSGPDKCRVITDDPTDCWMAWEEAMSRYQAHLDINVGF